MTKQHTNKKGEISYSYYHQALAAVQVCPGQAAVFPMAIEPICNADGSTKNDCEQNALKRLLPKIRELMPSEQLIGVYDALAANGPAIRAFNSEKIKYIITMKDGYVLHQIAALKQENSDKLNTHTWTTDTAKCTATYTSKLILNGSNLDIFVNYLEFTEICLKTDEITYQNAWITDLSLAQDMLQEFVAVARSRWKVENETFNTLKNQGYHLEHNYGVGKHFLATNFMLLAFIAFFIDQIALYCDTNFAKALSSAKSFKRLWERIRQFMDLTIAPSFDAIYRVIAKLDAFVKPILV